MLECEVDICQRWGNRKWKIREKGKMIREETRICKILIRIPESREREETKQEHFSDLKDTVFYMEGVYQVPGKINEKGPTLRQTIMQHTGLPPPKSYTKEEEMMADFSVAKLDVKNSGAVSLKF